MGFYVNPGNVNFREILRDAYQDKSGMLSVINGSIGTRRRLSCVSWPRRFGKSYAAKMLVAYYDCSVDSHELFDDLEIAKDPSYERYMNQYHVLYLDISRLISESSLDQLPAYIRECVSRELQSQFPYSMDAMSLADILSMVAEHEDRQFIAVIDEWDSPIRAARATEETKILYLEFLRSLFKSDVTLKAFAAAYMTGILPIKKDGSQSAISEFREYSVINPRAFAPYIGFLDKDVRHVCEQYHVSFEKMRDWYNGYHVNTTDGEVLGIYNPNSVM